jgi:type II secretory ATPase GspE/PulE/Tfp pilus assembly ATPase PilB-like protein
MSSDLISKNDKGINDLVGSSHNQPGHTSVNTDEVEEKLKEKIRQLDERKKEEVTREAADKLGYSYINLKGFPISPEAMGIIAEEEARSQKVVCFFKTDDEIRLGAVDPDSDGIKKIVAALADEFRANGVVYKISMLSLNAALKLYAKIPHPRKLVSGIEITEADLNRFKNEMGSFRDLNDKLQHISMTDMFTVIMAGAIKANASDVHIEAEQEDVKVRFRIDGVLYDVAVVPKKLWPQIINRAKLIARLKINVVDAPQDGRFTIYLTDEFVDVRVSTVPSAYGESIVMRLLMSSAAALTLDDLGLVGVGFDIMKKEIGRPNGMILTTGPTGSGKTTTLYAVLKKLKTPEKKIITLENPIEYRIDGITQSQVEASDEAEGDKTDIRKMLAAGAGSAKRHYNYSTGLRAVLRQDPDIVMVGEIRDHETAEIAIQAALTGHLMLSTLHTNSAAGAIPRLLSMEVKPFLLAPAMNVVIGQRLVRRVCPDCKEEYTPDPEIIKKVKEVLATLPDDKRPADSQTLKFFKGKGCPTCSNIGFKGRVGIFEILTMNEEIEKLILTGQVSEFQIQKIAKDHGMLTMLQDGILKAVQGIISAEEVLEVID